MPENKDRSRKGGERRERRSPISRHYDPYHGEKQSRSSLNDERAEGIIEGRNAVIEAFKAGRAIDKVYIAIGERTPALSHIAALAKEAGTVIADADKRKLDSMSVTGAHQGVIAIASVKEYCTLDDILNVAEERGEAPFVIVCDEISDHHNLGAIIRTAEAAGAHGVIIPKRRSAGATAIVGKTSAGAIEYMNVAREANITAVLKELKKRGLWVFGTSADGDVELWNADLKGPCAIVIGSEGEGMSRLVAENCDFKISIPMFGKVSSLNASASAAVVIYEAVRQRIK